LSSPRCVTQFCSCMPDENEPVILPRQRGQGGEMARRKRQRQVSKRIKSGSETPRYELSISCRGLTGVLLAVAITLLACHAALWVYHYRVAELNWLWLQLFDVDQENNLPTWFSQFLLILASALLWIRARDKVSQAGPFRGHWYVLSGGFLLMAVDEVAGVHESINSVIIVSWAIPAAGLVLLIGLAFVPFLLHLPRPTALLFGVAGALYLAGAIGAEIVGNAMVRDLLQNTLGYKLNTMAEESLEMFGMILFLYALLRYMRGPGTKPLRASLEVE
jgi:hypothetical protein